MPDFDSLAWMATAGTPMVAGAVLLGGLALGLLFFGGLWWTVQRATTSAAPARWFFGSLVLRTAVVLAGFHGLGAGQPLRLGLCLLGFWLGRAMVLRATRPPAAVTSAAASKGPPCA